MSFLFIYKRFSKEDDISKTSFFLYTNRTSNISINIITSKQLESKRKTCRLAVATIFRCTLPYQIWEVLGIFFRFKLTFDIWRKNPVKSMRNIFTKSRLNPRTINYYGSSVYDVRIKVNFLTSWPPLSSNVHIEVSSLPSICRVDVQISAESTASPHTLFTCFILKLFCVAANYYYHDQIRNIKIIASECPI